MNFAILGCGHIARKHAEAIRQIPGARLVAVCDKDTERMKEYKEAYGAAAYEDLAEMLEDPLVETVCICTPSGLHAPLGVQAANAGKHIVVEKPIALTIEDADRLIHACEANGVQLAVVHPNRFRPVVQELRRIFDSGLLGRISHVNSTVRWNRNQEYYDEAPWRGTKDLDGGVLMNQAIHNLDILVWFMGEPAEIFSMEATRLRNIEAEDVSIGTVTFQNGALGIVEAATTIYPRNYEESFSIFGEHGTVKIGGPNAIYFEHLDVEGLDEKETEDIIGRVKANPYGTPGHQCILADFQEAVRSGRKPAVDGYEGKKALKLVLDFYESARRGEPIRKMNKEIPVI